MEDKDVLIKSLKYINEIIKDSKKIVNEVDFLEIHERNKKMLLSYSIKNDSKFIKEEIAKYPSLNKEDLDYLSKKMKNEIDLYYLVSGFIFGFFIDLFKNKNMSVSKVKTKLNTIAEINVKMINVVENPFLESIYTGNG